MKYIHENSIANIPETELFDQIFRLKMSDIDTTQEKVKVYFLGELLKEKKNTDLESHIKEKPSMYANMYSEADEWDIFSQLCEEALQTRTKIHIAWITLQKEIDFLEEYYTKLGYMRSDINAFRVDFREVLLSASVHVENLIWKGSDYKRMGEKIFFLPPIRSAGETKAMYKGINRGVTAHIHIPHFSEDIRIFLENCVKNEHILPLTLGKVLHHHVKNMGIESGKREIDIFYGE